MQFPDVSGLLDHIGVTMHEVRSGELKAQPSVFAPPSEEALEALNELISDNFDWFVAQIEERRGLSQATIRGFEGTVFTGSRGMELGLVDAIGGEEAGIDYLAQAHGLDNEMDVLDRSPDRPLDWTGSSAMAVLGLSRDGGQLSIDATGLRESVRDAMLLDGIMSLWHGH
jgi:protease-4